MESSTANCRNSWYIFLLKCCLKKNDQNRKSVFISCDMPTPNFLRSENFNKKYFLKVKFFQYTFPLIFQNSKRFQVVISKQIKITK